VSNKRVPAQIRVEVTYALRDRQALIAVELPEGGTVEQAIQRSGVLTAFPEIELQRAKVGIFGRPIALGTPVRDGDRVEIYRPLSADPKELRRRKAARASRG
jgi:hypothetical protein